MKLKKNNNRWGRIGLMSAWRTNRELDLKEGILDYEAYEYLMTFSMHRVKIFMHKFCYYWEE